jgi:cyclophilin family peptidyl-prolyl cis-trans isomerase
MSRALSHAALIGLLLLLCASGQPRVARAEDAAAEAPRLADQRLVFRTTLGDIVFVLYSEVAPRHVAQLLELARLGVYDSTWFHRVEPGFLIQLSNAQNRTEPLDARQTAAIIKLPLEASPLRHRRGVISMAREDVDQNSAETSFSILLANAPHLDGKYTIFGEVALGWPVVEAIRGVRTDAKHQPLTRVSVNEVLVRTAAEVSAMAANGSLRGVEAGAQSEPAGGAGWTTASAIGLMMLCGLVIHLGARRWSPKLVGAIGLLSVLIGSVWVFAAFAATAKSDPARAIALFFGLLALFKLMNRFESSGPSPAPKSVPSEAGTSGS